jgi:hypothetical protein
MLNRAVKKTKVSMAEPEEQNTNAGNENNDVRMQEMESDGSYTRQFDTDSVRMKACEDEVMEDWENMSTALKQARHKKEFCDETAKKYWKIKAADFVREKRARVLHNNREAKKQ